ncbi:unnamed protein product [Boreogadus saida]
MDTAKNKIGQFCDWDTLICKFTNPMEPKSKHLVLLKLSLAEGENETGPRIGWRTHSHTVQKPTEQIPADARSKLLEVKDLMSIIGSGTMHLGQNTLTWVMGKMQLQLRVGDVAGKGPNLSLEHFGATVEFREYQAQVKQHMEEEFSPSSTGSGVCPVLPQTFANGKYRKRHLKMPSAYFSNAAREILLK